MKKTFQEKLKSKVNSWCKKHPKLQKLYTAYFVTVLFFYYLGLYFVQNSKRYLCIGVFVLFFMTNASFAFYGTDAVRVINAETSDIKLVVDEELDTTEIELLDDEDVMDEEMEEYLEADYHSQTGAEQYTLDDIMESHGQYLENSDERDKKYDSDSAQDLNFSEDDWKLVLVNKQHPIPEDYTFELEVITDGMKCDKRIMEDLLLMLTEAKEQGINLAIRSPYRDMSRQIYLFNRKINRYMSSGMSYMDAYKTASQSVTVPGASEHQIGLALDITGDTYYVLDEAFGDTKEGIWLAEHSHEYGFILRYPKGKEYITSIGFEPWHFRYVGVEAATVMYENDLCLEEFWDEYVY